jgi:hypothetical protein
VDRLSDNEKNIEVQSVAVRCLSSLIPRITESRIKEVGDSLAEAFATGKAELRDVYGIGLRTLVLKAPEAYARCVCSALFARLLTLVDAGADAAAATAAGGGAAGAGAGAAKSGNAYAALAGSAAARATGVLGDLRSQAIDVLTEMLRRFGAALTTPELTAALACFRKALGSPAATVRARAGVALAAAAALFDQDQLETLLGSLFAGVRGHAAGAAPGAGGSALDDAQQRVIIVTLGNIAKVRGGRMERSGADLGPSRIGAGTAPGPSRDWAKRPGASEASRERSRERLRRGAWKIAWEFNAAAVNVAPRA